MRNRKRLITSTTVALFPAYHHSYQTIILDLAGRKIYSEKPALDIINEACLHDGASYEGKIQAVRHALPYLRKTPLIINKDQHIYAFPTMSPHKYECVWLFHLHIQSFSQNQNKTTITFTNGRRAEVNCSIKVLNRQRERAAATMNHFTFKHVEYIAGRFEKDEDFEFQIYTEFEQGNQNQSQL